jgi:5-methylcytosine-specific restriction endonuclease McrA
LSKEIRAKSPGANKLPHGHASRNELLASYKKSAKERGIAWNLEKSEFFELVSGNCAYCGSPPDLVRKPNKQVNGGFVYSGIDRVDNNIGYEADNVVSCCWNCNRAKGVMDLPLFLEWIDRLSSYQSDRNTRFEHGENPAALRIA